MVLLQPTKHAQLLTKQGQGFQHRPLQNQTKRKKMIKLNAQAVTLDAAPGDMPTRTITGIAVPYGETAVVSDGTAVRFEQGALPVDGKAPKLFMYHDSSQPVGLVTERVDTPQGMMFAARISATAAGDEALTLALDGVLDSVSVGVNPTKFSYDDDGTMVVTEASWLELSLVPVPAFAGAEIEKVYASAENVVLASQEEPDTEPTTEQVEETETVDAVQPEAVVEAATPTAPIPAQPKRKFALPTPGEYMAAMHIGGTTFANVSAAANEYMLSKQSALQAAAGDVLTTNTPGLLPVPVLGPVFDDLNYIRPVVAAVGARAMPDGGQSKTWIRPTWTTHTSVAAQGGELVGVSATTPQIASNVVGKTTLSGAVQFSIQDIDFTSPAALEIILRDLAGQYMLASDNVAADAIVAGATASGATWDVTANDPSTLISAIYTSAYNILLETNFLPDHIFVAPGVWQALGAQLDADKRPVFPYVGAAGLMGVNAMGSANVTVANTFNPFGLNLVADRNFAAGTMVVARGQAIEFYEQVRGIMSVEVPETLGRKFSYYGYVSTFIADSTQVQSIAVV
jgi:HK97 family phage prohead protease